MSRYTLMDALGLARDLKHGPMAPADAPAPDVAEALAWVREEQKRTTFNWLTGQAAMELLRARTYAVDRKLGDLAMCGFPDKVAAYVARRPALAGRLAAALALPADTDLPDSARSGSMRRRLDAQKKGKSDGGQGS